MTTAQPDPQPGPQDTVATARDWYRNRAQTDDKCPVCDHRIVVYRRPLNAQMARFLIALARYTAETTEDDVSQWVHVNRLGIRWGWATQLGGDYAKVRFWQLAEVAVERRADGSSRNGHWRITPAGSQFAYGRLQAPRWATIVDNQLRELHGPPISVRDALGARFDYAQLMRDSGRG